MEAIPNIDFSSGLFQLYQTVAVLPCFEHDQSKKSIKCSFHYRLVTPYSVMEFRVLMKQSMRSDHVVGSTKLSLYDILKSSSGTRKAMFLICVIVMDRIIQICCIHWLLQFFFKFNWKLRCKFAYNIDGIREIAVEISNLLRECFKSGKSWTHVKNEMSKECFTAIVFIEPWKIKCSLVLGFLIILFIL